METKNKPSRSSLRRINKGKAKKEREALEEKERDEERAKEAEKRKAEEALKLEREERKKNLSEGRACQTCKKYARSEWNLLENFINRGQIRFHEYPDRNTVEFEKNSCFCDLKHTELPTGTAQVWTQHDASYPPPMCYGEYLYDRDVYSCGKLCPVCDKKSHEVMFKKESLEQLHNLAVHARKRRFDVEFMRALDQNKDLYICKSRLRDDEINSHLHLSQIWCQCK